jgi:hypothetical protein
MVKKVLPPLNEQNQIPNIATSGEWKSEDSSFLEKLSKGLKIGGEDLVSASDIVSVPDVWARVLIVRNGLLDDEKSIVREWRGTLALLGLAPYYTHVYKLTSSIVNLTDIRKNPFTSTNTSSNAETNTSPNAEYDHIGNILFDVKPHDTMAQDQNWNSIGVLKFNDDAIAIVNPYTMLAAGRDYTKVKKIRQLPWYEDGFLIDPCDAKDMRNEQYLVLSHYIGELISNIQSIPFSNIEIFNSIMGRLKEFKKDCDAKIAGASFSNWASVRLDLNLPSQPIYDKLAQVYSGVSDEKPKFDCGLEPRPEFSEYINGAVISDFRVAQSAGKTLSDIRVWKNYSLNSLRQDSDLERKLKNECEKEGYLYLTPETIFTQKLVIFAGDNRQLKEHTKDGDQYAYPVNSAMLMFIDPKTLSTNCKVSAEGDNYNVTFYLELKSDTGSVTSYALKKTYKAKDVVKNRTVPLSFSVWPDIKTDSWNQYYFFYDGNLQVNVLPKNIFAVKDIRKKLEKLAPLDRVKFVEGMINSHQIIGEEVPIQQSTAITELRGLESSPEAISCNVATQQGGKAFVDHPKRLDVGLILFPDPQPIQDTSNQWSVGIDFGTTNSCVYIKENKDAPKQLNFKNRINLPYEPGTDEEEKEEVMQAHKEFVPSRLINVPFMTILRERTFKETSAENLPFRSNFIYYVDQVLFAIADLPDDRRPLKFNLKWDEAEQSRTKVQYFLSQLILQTCVEAAANGIKPENITFSFSYPEAYDKGFALSFRKQARRAIEVGLSEENSKIKEKTTFRTESISSALYFAEGQKIPFVQNVVTIDIGGGTSDLSIWQNLNLIWRNSFRLAGKDVLIDYLTNNLTLIKEISGNDELLLESYDNLQKVKSNKIKLANGIELLVNSPQFGKVFASRFDTVSGKGKGAELKHLSELALSGILYYVCLVLNHLIEQGQFKQDLSKSLKICLGGKASTLYKIVFEDAEAQEGLSKMVEKVTKGVFNSVSIEFTQAPKHEVSYGLLVATEGSKDLNIKERSFETVLGESVTAGKSKIGIVSKLNPDNDWRVKDLTQINSFVKSLQAYSKISVKLTQKFSGDLEGHINASLKDAQVKALNIKNTQESVEADASMTEIIKSTSIIEPIFIQELKEIIHEVTSGKIKLK